MSLQSLLERHAMRQPFVMALGVRNIETGEEVSVNGSELFPMASTFKVPVLYTLMHLVDRREVSLEERIRVPEGPALGSGALPHFHRGVELTVRDLAYLMIIISDNLATDLLVDRIGGLEKVNMLMAKLGLHNIHVRMDCYHLLCEGLGLDPDNRELLTEIIANPEKMESLSFSESSLIFRQVPENNVASPTDMCRLLSEIVRPTQLSPEASKEIVKIMGHQHLRQRIPALLPDKLHVINKTGTVRGTRCDVGVLMMDSGPVAISAFLHNVPENMGWDGDLAIAQAARLVHDYYLDSH
ncbi:serine hydrolase [Alicyclobacillus mengziensis]|uniref:Serine hydrolase n=1 Tax=Alicyclobacillus mengziensis TaxID=2931921 RepID=A0A9X7W265_9BACL|nr:serine hydrolase [Alicyclobacillus mengziensis]QSO49326.1 serine hydrolase [Alicyclobacillus mengziensis]